MKSTKLANKIIVMLIISILVPVVIVVSYNFYVFYKNSNENFRESSNSSLSSLALFMNEEDKINSENIQMLSNDPNVNDVIKNADCESWLLNTLKSFQETHEDTINIYYGLNNGKMFIAPEKNKVEGLDPRERPWYKDAVAKNGEVIITDAYEDAGQKGLYVVTYAKAVKDKKTGEIMGVVGIDIKLESLSSQVSKVKTGQNGFLAVLDKTGKIIASENSNLLGKTSKDEPWIEQVVALKGNSSEVNINGSKYITNVVISDGNGWSLAAFMPVKEINDKIYQMAVITVIVSIIALFLAIAGGMIFVKTITKPINNVVNVLNKIRQGDYTETMEKGKNETYEVEIIIDSVNEVVDVTKGILTRLLETSIHMREASDSLAAISEESSAVGKEVSIAINDISQGAVEQAGNLEDASNLTNVLGEEVNKAIENANNMIKASKEVEKTTSDGLNVIDNLKETFGETSKANYELAKEVGILKENSDKITTIADTIKDITEQTNLLALNASIEASRAGEAGKGFAVVADEVRKLAEQSSVSAQEINNVILDMKLSVLEVLKKIEYSKSVDVKTKENVKITNESFNKIEKVISHLQSNIGDVMQSLEEIDKDKNMAVIKITEVAAVSQETAATVEEVSASSEEQTAGLQRVVSSAETLKDLSHTLEKMVMEFKL